MEIGFGHTEHNASSNVRRRLEQHGFNWTQCNNIYEQTVGPNEMCAGNEHKDMCIGDSGIIIISIIASDEGSTGVNYSS